MQLRGRALHCAHVQALLPALCRSATAVAEACRAIKPLDHTATAKTAAEARTNLSSVHKGHAGGHVTQNHQNAVEQKAALGTARVAIPQEVGQRPSRAQLLDGAAACKRSARGAAAAAGILSAHNTAQTATGARASTCTIWSLKAATSAEGAGRGLISCESVLTTLVWLRLKAASASCLTRASVAAAKRLVTCTRAPLP